MNRRSTIEGWAILVFTIALTSATSSAQTAQPAEPSPTDPSLVPVERCRYGISKDLTEKIFKFAATGFPAGSHCAFSGVITQKTVLGIEWTFDQQKQPPIQITPIGCHTPTAATPESLVLEVPNELTTHCPDMQPFVTQLRTLVSGEAALVGIDKGRQSEEDAARRKRLRTYGFAAAILAVIGVVYARSRMRRKELDGTPPPPASPPPAA